MTTSSRGFLGEAIRYLREVYLGRLRTAMSILPTEDLWWRPHSGVISCGNILLHLEGNVRQWLISGVGGLPDQRNRKSEFAATKGPEKELLMERLAVTVLEACGVIEGLTPTELESEKTIQGFATTGRDAIFHVVEHFSWHTGQAVWIAKARAGVDHGVAFYDDDQVNEARNP